MDCQMPVMDGYTATQKIRQSTEAYKDITIVAMTANAMIGDKEKCLAAGMDEYLTKPIDIDALESCLLSVLGLTDKELVNGKQVDKTQTEAQGVQIWHKEEFLKRVSQNQKLAQRIVTVFCQDIPKEVDKLNQVTTDIDLHEVEAVIHKIKGVSANLEAQQLAECALKVEHAIKKNNTEEITAFIVELNEHVNVLMVQLKDYLSAV